MTQTKTHGNDQTLFYVGIVNIFWRQNTARSKNNKLKSERRRLIVVLNRASFLEFKLQVGDV